MQAVAVAITWHLPPPPHLKRWRCGYTTASTWRATWKTLRKRERRHKRQESSAKQGGAFWLLAYVCACVVLSDTKKLLVTTIDLSN